MCGQGCLEVTKASQGWSEVSRNCVELAWIERDLVLAPAAAVATEVLAAGVELPLRTMECAQQPHWLPKEGVLGLHTLLPPHPHPTQSCEAEGPVTSFRGPNGLLQK